MSETRLSDTMIGKMAMTSLTNPNWDNLSPETATARINEELQTPQALRDNITYYSEQSSITKIAELVGLTPAEIEQLTVDVDIKSSVSPEIASKIKAAIEEKGVNESVVSILSSIHDDWVRNAGKKFDAPKRENKLYQYVPLELLDFKETEFDLVFLKPILEGAGIEIDEKDLEQHFLAAQEKFKEIHGIDSKSSLKESLARGAEFYPVLDGVKDANGKLITEKLAEEPELLDRMTDQVATRSQVKEKEAVVTMDDMQKFAETGRIGELSDATKVIKEIEREENQQGQDGPEQE